MTPVRAGHFDWASWQSLLDKAERDLATFRAGPDYPLDVLFNLVTTINHVWDWASKDANLPHAKRQAAKAVRTIPDVSAIRSLAEAAKHLNLDWMPQATTDTTHHGWGDMAWGSAPWGGGTTYRVEVNGTMRDVADVAADAITAWRNAMT